jgi:DNA-binding MarR family transcriptional regulator
MMALDLLDPSARQEDTVQDAMEILAVQADGLTVRDLRILFYVASHDGCTINEIRTRTGVTGSDLMKSLSALATPQYRFIVRQPTYVPNQADAVRITLKGVLILNLFRFPLENIGNALLRILE